MGRNSRKNTSGIAANIAAAAAAASTQDIEALLREDPVSAEDIAMALKTTKPSSDGKIAKYVLFFYMPILDVPVFITKVTLLCPCVFNLHFDSMIMIFLINKFL